jgi:hypothetical protein
LNNGNVNTKKLFWFENLKVHIIKMLGLINVHIWKNKSFIIEICSFRKNVLEWKMHNNCFKKINNENIIIEICSYRNNVHEWKMFIYEICSNVKFVLKFEINHIWKYVHNWKMFIHQTWIAKIL